MKNKFMLTGVGVFTFLMLTSCAPIFEDIPAEISPVVNGSTTESIGTSTSPIGTTTTPDPVQQSGSTTQGTTTTISPTDSPSPAGSSTPIPVDTAPEIGSTSSQL